VVAVVALQLAEQEVAVMVQAQMETHQLLQVSQELATQAAVAVAVKH
jgi:hypothetical protein